MRVAIARAVIGDPLVLLADEPTGNLDEGNALAILEVFRALHARGTTMLIATHSHELIEAYPQRVVEIRNGQVIRGA